MRSDYNRSCLKWALKRTSDAQARDGEIAMVIASGVRGIQVPTRVSLLQLDFKKLCERCQVTKSVLIYIERKSTTKPRISARRKTQRTHNIASYTFRTIPTGAENRENIAKGLMIL